MLVPLLRRDGELDLSDVEAALLVGMSAATVDRRLAPARAAMMVRGRSHTKPGSLLKSQIPVQTWADWDDARPGFVQVDLVGHEGGNASGEFAFTLTVTDIATGWTVNRSVRNKAQRWVFEALEYARVRFPFPIAQRWATIWANIFAYRPEPLSCTANPPASGPCLRRGSRLACGDSCVRPTHGSRNRPQVALRSVDRECR
jgi:hypothetical protein